LTPIGAEEAPHLAKFYLSARRPPSNSGQVFRRRTAGQISEQRAPNTENFAVLRVFLCGIDNRFWLGLCGVDFGCVLRFFGVLRIWGLEGFEFCGVFERFENVGFDFLK
jgi:hypothetical protein